MKWAENPKKIKIKRIKRAQAKRHCQRKSRGVNKKNLPKSIRDHSGRMTQQGCARSSNPAITRGPLPKRNDVSWPLYKSQFFFFISISLFKPKPPSASLSKRPKNVQPKTRKNLEFGWMFRSTTVRLCYRCHAWLPKKPNEPRIFPFFAKTPFIHSSLWKSF